MSKEEMREFVELTQINDEQGLTDEEWNRYLFLREKMEQDDFDEFLIVSLGLFL
jgi:hypothetical protein